MKRYLLYIKSHCEYPDYEDEVEAMTKDEAIELFHVKLKGEYDREFLRENVVCEDEINR